MRTSDFLVKHEDLWMEACDHEFLSGVRKGTLPTYTFETWLVQDYLFVTSEVRYVSRLVPRAPRRDQSLLISGLADLEAELTWFEDRAAERGLSLDDVSYSLNTSYDGFMRSLENEPYVVNIVALWAIEQAYLDSWSSASPCAGEYRPFVEHWTMPEFSDYVTKLRNAADDALSRSDERKAHRAEEAFISIARLERDFWSLAYSKVEV